MMNLVMLCGVTLPQTGSSPSRRAAPCLSLRIESFIIVATEAPADQGVLLHPQADQGVDGNQSYLQSSGPPTSTTHLYYLAA